VPTGSESELHRELGSCPGLSPRARRRQLGEYAPGLYPNDFIWATGIEDTFVPQTKVGHRALDEYELMGPYEHWREDLALACEVGVRAIRWDVPWYRVEPRQATPMV
jgi:hypothetical protein